MFRKNGLSICCIFVMALLTWLIIPISHALAGSATIASGTSKYKSKSTVTDILTISDLANINSSRISLFNGVISSVEKDFAFGPSINDYLLLNYTNCSETSLRDFTETMYGNCLYNVEDKNSSVVEHFHNPQPYCPSSETKGFYAGRAVYDKATTLAESLFNTSLADAIEACGNCDIPEEGRQLDESSSSSEININISDNTLDTNSLFIYGEIEFIASSSPSPSYDLTKFSINSFAPYEIDASTNRIRIEIPLTKNNGPLSLVPAMSDGVVKFIPYSFTLGASTVPPVFTPPATDPKDKGKNPCNSTSMGSSANLKSGNYYHNQAVVDKPASLALELSYNSLETLDTPLGKGWTHSFNISLKEVSNVITLKLDDGDILKFVLSGSVYLPVSNSSETSSIIKNTDNSYTRTFKSGHIQTFNGSGQLTSSIDTNGNITTLIYSGSDLTTINDSTGRNININSSGGRISNIVDPAGRITTFGYTGNLLTSVTNPVGTSWQYTYDSNGMMVKKTNPSGYQSINKYDVYGKNISNTDHEGKIKTIHYYTETSTIVTEKDGSTWTRTYDSVLNAPTETSDQLGNTATQSYDDKGNLLTSTTPYYDTTRYTYDSDNNMTSITDPLGHKINYTYNNLGQVLTRSESAAAIPPPVLSFALNNADELNTLAASSERTTTNIYDGKGNLLQTVDSKGFITTYTYDTKGNLLTTTDPRNKTITFAYDSYNNVSSITDQKGKITSFTHDVLGNLLTETNPAGKTTTYEYDVMNRLIKTIDPLGHITQYTYDNMGNRLTATDRNGKTTSYTYNYKNQPLTITDALGNVTTMAYSGSGCGSCGGSGNDKLVSVTDANNNTTRYEYDLVGNMVKEIDPRGNIISYDYNPNGKIISKTDGNARSTTYSYDANGRLVSRTYQDGTSDTFTYDALGNIITAANDNINYTLGYNANNKLKRIVDNTGRKISYAYNANSNRTKITAPDGRITTYAYDAKNRLIKLTDNSNVYAFTYNVLDRRTKLTNPNGTYTTYNYDADSRLTKLITSTSAETVVDSITNS